MKWDNLSCGRTVHVVVRGDVNCWTSEGLQRALTDSSQLRQPHVELDLTDVSYLSTAGINVILAARQQLLRCEGSLRILKASPEVAAVLQQCHLEELLIGPVLTPVNRRGPFPTDLDWSSQPEYGTLDLR